MNGILNVLKPSGMTSFDVVAYVRRLLNTKKVGHAGTLDPMAAGVLPVCAGNATRAIEFLIDKDKLYRAELTLGITTDTQDSTGKVLSTRAPECSDEDIEKAVKSFEGVYLQKPPMYSALKVGGKKLYELAREGAEIERQSRAVEIYSADVLDISRKDGVRVLIDVHCSKGTYIRTLCADIGDKLGCGGHMSFLLRKRAGIFDIEEAYTLEELREKQCEGTISMALLGVERVFNDLPGFFLDRADEKKFLNGMTIKVHHALNYRLQKDNDGYDVDKENCKMVRVYDASGKFIALGKVRNKEGVSYLKVGKFFLE